MMAIELRRRVDWQQGTDGPDDPAAPIIIITIMLTV